MNLIAGCSRVDVLLWSAGSSNGGGAPSVVKWAGSLAAMVRGGLALAERPSVQGLNI